MPKDDLPASRAAEPLIPVDRTSPWLASYKDGDKYTTLGVVAWSATGEALVGDARGYLVPARTLKNFRALQQDPFRGPPVSSIAPSDGWRYRYVDDGKTVDGPIAGWVVGETSIYADLVDEYGYVRSFHDIRNREYQATLYHPSEGSRRS